MNNMSKYKNRKRTGQANSSESAMNTREARMMSKETSDPMTEPPTVETILDTEATPDKEATSGAEALSQSRSLDAISEEFSFHYHTGSESVYRMGELLNEAKAQLPEYGTWLDWLRSVNFPPRQAQRLMRLAKGYPDTTTLSELGLCKALILLKVPADERDEFIEEPHMVLVDGKPMSIRVHEMTVKELADVVRQKYGTTKKPAPEFTSQAPPPMPHNDALQASESVGNFDIQFEHLEFCINNLFKQIEELESSSDERDELTDELRNLLDEALQRIQTS